MILVLVVVGWGISSRGWFKISETERVVKQIKDYSTITIGWFYCDNIEYYLMVYSKTALDARLVKLGKSGKVYPDVTKIRLSQVKEINDVLILYLDMLTNHLMVLV